MIFCWSIGLRLTRCFLDQGDDKWNGLTNILLIIHLINEVFLSIDIFSGAPCSQRHLKKKAFIDSIKKSLQTHGSSNKSIIEAGAITCVKLCKAATYINVLDSNNVIFSLVQTVINDLKNLLFKVNTF